jgi:hypothetical protein
VKIVAGIIIVLVVLAGIVLLLPEQITPPPPSTGGSSTITDISVPAGEDKVATQKSIDASNAMLQKASQVLIVGDGKAFAEFLPAKSREALGDTPAIRTDFAQELATSLKSAKVTAAYPKIVYYEIRVRNSPYTFYTTEEEGSWKIAGL